MEKPEPLTNPNKAGLSGAAELKQAVFDLDPLGVMPEVGHLLPKINLVEAAKEPEAGAAPLKNKRREEFCRVLTGWGGDGLRKRNCEAYEIVYGKKGATARTQSSWLLSVPEVKDRVAWLERKVEEAKRHDFIAAQQEIDTLRLGIIEKAQKNSKLAPVALVAARDFEKAHGLDGGTDNGGGKTTNITNIQQNNFAPQSLRQLSEEELRTRLAELGGI